MIKSKAELLAMPAGLKLDREVQKCLHSSKEFPTRSEYETVGNVKFYDYWPISTDANIAMRVWRDRFGDRQWYLGFSCDDWFIHDDLTQECISIADQPALAIVRAMIEEMMK